MDIGTRKVLNRAFTGLGVMSIGLLAVSLAIILGPIVTKGSRAFWFRATIEHRRLLLEKFHRGDEERIASEVAEAGSAREPLYQMIAEFEEELKSGPRKLRRQYRGPLRELKETLKVLLGPAPGDRRPVLTRDQYGQTRWDRAKVKLHDVLYVRSYDYSDPTKMGVEVWTPRGKEFEGTSLQKLFPYLENNIEDMLRPRRVFYWRFLTDKSKDAHFFGGIWAEMVGTIFLTFGAVIFAVPMGVIAAIYLVEYAKEGVVISIIRTFISTLAGVPSIAFGLFGLAFFIGTLRVTNSKSVLAGSLTLALLILPMVIRASEEAIRAVPQTYKEAALSLGASRWRTVLTVILPSSLPGILTGIVISMGRAAGETAPIIFTAAVSLGKPLKILSPIESASSATPALPWNIYNLCTEHQAVDEIRHVQYGMVFTLVAIVLLLNLTAIILRARISKKLRG